METNLLLKNEVNLDEHKINQSIWCKYLINQIFYTLVLNYTQSIGPSEEKKIIH